AADERAAAFVHRRAGSVNIVDQQDGFVLDRALGGDGERPAHVAAALVLMELSLRRRLARANERERVDRQFPFASDLAREDDRLIEAAPLQPLSVERDGKNDVDRVL